MPRPCSVCVSPQRPQIEAALAEWESFASVSRDSRFTGLSVDSIERHWRNHLAQEVRGAGWTEGRSALSIAERLSALAVDASGIRMRAMETGDGRLALQAIKLEADLLSKLLERLGVEPDTVEVAFAEAETLIRVIAKIARQSPRAGDWIADQVPAEQAQLAEAIRGVARNGSNVVANRGA